MTTTSGDPDIKTHDIRMRRPVDISGPVCDGVPEGGAALMRLRAQENTG